MKRSTALSLILLLAVMPLMAQWNQLPVLKITFTGTLSSTSTDYLNGSMTLTDPNGKVVEMPAKYRMRGATAKEYSMKPSINMKLRNADYTEEADSALLGMRSCSSWILDAMAIDRVCMRNRVLFDIWNQFSRLPYDTDFGGRNGTEGRFVELYMNNKYLGIYCLSDRINRKLLNLKKVKIQDDGTPLLRGALYKNGTTDVLDQNTAGFFNDYSVYIPEWHNAWELTDPEDYACEAVWEPLVECFKSSGRTASYVKKTFFIDNLAEYQLFIMAFCISDNWGNKNHYFSVRNMNKDIDDADATESDRRRIVITPWDLDTGLGGDYKGRDYNGDFTHSQDFTPATIVKNGGHYPFTYLQGDAQYNALLKQKWVENRKGALSYDNVARIITQYTNLFVNSGAWQRMVNQLNTFKYKPCYVQDVAAETTILKQWYKDRFALMDSYFGITDATVSYDAADVNHDGKVDTQDVLQIYDYMKASVNSSNIGATEDVNQDCMVDTQDVLMVYEYMKAH